MIKDYSRSNNDFINSILLFNKKRIVETYISYIDIPYYIRNLFYLILKTKDNEKDLSNPL